MTMTDSRPRSHRRVDLAGLSLLLLGVIFGAMAYWAIAHDDANPLVIVPSVVAATIGATHLTKREAPRD